MHILTITFTSVLILILPGLAIHTWLGDGKKGFAEQLASCIGLSISVTAALYLLTFYFHFQIGPGFLAFFHASCGMLYVAGLLYKHIRPSWSWEIPITLLLLALVLVLRFIQIKELVLPAWVDSIHHVLITRVIIETGSIPATLEPYLAVPFSYYFGFHGLAAIFSMISGFPVEKAVLILGQVLNACVPLAIYRLGRAMWGDRARPLIAALLVAFVSQMPAYYATWGRYPLLTGLIMLAFTMAELIEISRKTQPRVIDYSTFPLLIIGLVLAHYFSAVLFIVYCALFLAFFHGPRGLKEYINAGKIGIVILFSFIVLAPWLFRAYSLLNYNLNVNVNLPVVEEGWQNTQTYGLYLLKLSGPWRNYVFLLFGILGLIPIWVDKHGRSLAIWALLILMTALPIGIKLPNIRPDHMAIILFFPLSLSASFFLVRVWEKLRSLFVSKYATPLATLVFTGFCIWGMVETSSIINKSTVLVDENDLHAIQWVKENIPANARFLINAAYWQGATYRGIDGGYWLLPLTGHFTIPPPVIYAWGDGGDVIEMNTVSRRIANLNSCTAEFREIIHDQDISHIYIKDGIGSIQAINLSDCPDMEPLFSQDGVTIYAIDNGLK